MIANVQEPSSEAPADPGAASPAPAAVRRRKTSPVLAVCLYLFFVFIGAALAAPRFFATAQFLNQEVSWRFSRLALQPFHRFIIGSLVLIGIIALPSLLKSLQIRSAREMGLVWGGRHVAEALQGIGWGIVSFLVLCALCIASNIRVVDTVNSARWLNELLSAVLGSFGIAFLAELIFRGALFSALRRTRSFLAAALFSAVIYAVLFFVEKPASVPQRVEWTTGFAVVGQMFSAFTMESLVPAFLNLTFFGVLLALLFERTGALHFSIGLAVSAIFCLKSFGLLTNPTSRKISTFWGSDKLIDGWAASFVLLLVFLLVERTVPPRKLAAS